MTHGLRAFIHRVACVAVATTTLALIVPSGTAQAGTPAVAPPSATAPAPDAGGKKTSASKTAPGRQTDRSTTVRATYSKGGADFTVLGVPRRSYEVTFSTHGSVSTTATRMTVAAGPSGSAKFSVPLTVAPDAIGSITAELSFDDAEAHLQSTGSLWLAPDGKGGLVEGASMLEAQINALKSAHPDAQDQKAAWHAFSTMSPSRQSHKRVTNATTTSAATAAAAQTTVSGTIVYHDWNNQTHPARHINVDIDEVGVFGSHLGSTTTDDSGHYSFSLSIGGATDVQTTFHAQTSAGRVGTSSLFGLRFTTYSEHSPTETIRPGDTSSTDRDLGGMDAISNSFSILDAAWSAHLFAQASGHGDEASVDIDYPSGSDQTANTGSDGISLGSWEWSAWDVINHEYGHWYDQKHHLSPLIGGKHCTTDNLASVTCANSPYGKDNGGKLAWSEGWADYYSIASGKVTDHPALVSPGANYTHSVGDGFYDDTKYTEAGVFQGPQTFFAVADNSDPASYHGEDNEFSISGVLLNSALSTSSGLGVQYLSTLAEGAQADRLSDFVAYAWASDNSSRILGNQELFLGCQLSTARIAPYDLTPTSTQLSQPPTLSWQAGNTAGSGTLYPNDSFTVQAIDPVSAFPYFTSPVLSATSWTPSGREWSQIAAGRATVRLRVVGTSTSTPQTGPYRGCAVPVAVDSGALASTADCAANTLPANDDGSTPPVDLPFPVNFLGTTYTFLYVNNNGNVTFNQPLSTYTPFTLSASTPPIIAPFFADVDTRGSGSAPVQYGYGTTTFNGHRAFCVDWVNVGYYAAHTDKLTSAQLLLVERADQGAGDFDIVFNYGHVGWETGDASGGAGGFGGTPVGVGYSAGTGQPDAFFQMPGSLQTHQFTDGDPHALVSNSNRGLTPGQYLFPVRNGAAGSSSTGIRGTVTSGGFPVSSAPVQVCPHGGGQCVFQTRSADDGTYTAVGIPPGSYDVSAYPPSGLNGRPATVSAVGVTANNITTVDINLQQIAGVPAGTNLGPLVGTGTVPMVNWNDLLTLRTTGCIGGTASYEILSTESGSLGASIASGPMSTDGQGHYSATLPPLYPHHGAAQVGITIVCPDGTVQTVQFDIYIDPSGQVVDQAGRAVPDATVTLSRSDTAEGTFTVVPSGSDLMSPANRANPMTTGATGHFGWDVVAGFYKVTAAKDGCTTVSSNVLAVPPAVTDLHLTLTCQPRDTQPPVITVVDQRLEGNTRGGWAGSLPGATATDPDSPIDQVRLTNDATSLLALGVHTVNWTATDPAGNTSTKPQTVTIIDTTPPSINCPPALATLYTRSPQLGMPTVADIVDASPAVTDNRPSAWPLGTTQVTWTATDASGNQSTCVQAVTLSLPTTATIAGGDKHSLVLLADGTVRAWGAGGNGQLGQGKTVGSTTPIAVTGLVGVKAVAAGGLFSLALTSDGSVYAWGDNSTGQLGDGTTKGRSLPMRVPGLPPIAAVTAGHNHVLAIGIDGRVWSWGANTYGQTSAAASTAVLAPIVVPGLTNVVSVAAGQFHSVAAVAGGSVYAWGAGYSGQLGDGTQTSRAIPKLVPGFTGVVSVGAGYQHSMAVTAAGALYTWGANANGQLGNATAMASSVPVRVSLPSPAKAARGGSDHTLVLLANGTAVAFGRNQEGQLGDGTRVDRRSPVAVSGVSSAAAVAAGASHSLAGISGGKLDAWGENTAGQIGDGTTTRRPAPVLVSGITTLAQLG